jgi:cellulose synthase/poly-beta-1,6-N-acetylglucosamine synthase-like glycosyltransferase
VEPDPIVSILLPVCDAVSYLPACLRSIRRQTEPRFECIVVDDGSTDGSAAVARAAAAEDPRIRVLTRPHQGLVPALNAGLAHCRGRFVARMDADDVMHRQRLACQLEELAARPELAAVGCHVRLFPRESLGPGMRAYESWLASIDSARRVREEAFVECPVAHPTLTLRREVLAVHGYRDRGWPEDYDLVLRLLEAGHEIGVVARRLHAWRNPPQRLSRTSDTYAIERFTACKAAFLVQSFLRETDRYVLWGYGGTGKTLYRALRALGRQPSAIVELHPGRLGTLIHGAPVITPSALRPRFLDPVVVSVAGATARAEIRADLARMGCTEMRDYVCAA